MSDGLQRIWYRPEPPPWPLRPLSKLYGAIADSRARRQKLGARQLPVPTVVVGNVAVGGTGKTPCVLWLVEALLDQGRRPGILSRGYGGRGPFPRLVNADDDASRVGDEPLLLARRSGVPVAIAPDRPAAGDFLLEQHPEVDVLVCDDGLQHYRLHRDAEICVIDGKRGYGNGWRLPAGPLREPAKRALLSDVLLINGAAASPYGERAGRFDLNIQEAVHLRSGQRMPLSALAGQVVHAVAGIGAPQRFFDALIAAGLKPDTHPFPDHYRYRAEDLDFGDNHPVLMTEKDAVKCRHFEHPDLWMAPATACLSPDAQVLVRQLMAKLKPAS